MTINQLPTLNSAASSDLIPVSYNGADYKLPLGNLIKSKTVNDTTSASGNINITEFDADSHVIIISAIREDAASLVIPFWSYQNGCWAVHVMSASNHNVVASTAVEVAVYYLEIDLGQVVPN